MTRHPSSTIDKIDNALTLFFMKRVTDEHSSSEIKANGKNDGKVQETTIKVQREEHSSSNVCAVTFQALV